MTALGETKSIAEWAEISGLTRGLIHHRIGKGMSPEDALFSPVIPKEKKKFRKSKISSHPAYRIALGLISRERMQRYRAAGMWYKIFELEDSKLQQFPQQEMKVV